MSLQDRGRKAKERKKKIEKFVASQRQAGKTDWEIVLILEESDEFFMNRQRAQQFVYGKVELPPTEPKPRAPQFLNDWERET